MAVVCAHRFATITQKFSGRFLLQGIDKTDALMTIVAAPLFTAAATSRLPPAGAWVNGDNKPQASSRPWLLRTPCRRGHPRPGTREGGIADNVLPPVEAEASGWVAFASGAVVH